jgi:hypothetical protein
MRPRIYVRFMNAFQVEARVRDRQERSHTCHRSKAVLCFLSAAPERGLATAHCSSSFCDSCIIVRDDLQQKTLSGIMFDGCETKTFQVLFRRRLCVWRPRKERVLDRFYRLQRETEPWV